MKIEIFKKENNFNKKIFTFNPNLYWELAIFCALALITASFFYGHYLFIKVSQESALPLQNQNVQTSMVNKDRILKILNFFSDRETQTNKILNSPVPVVDPSL